MIEQDDDNDNDDYQKVERCNRACFIMSWKEEKLFGPMKESR